MRQLNLPDKKFIVIGSGIMEAKGIRKANDLDIIVPPEVFAEIKKDASWAYTQKIDHQGDKIDILEKDDCQIFYNIYGEHDFDYFMKHNDATEVVEGIYFGSLAMLLSKKESRGKAKDIDDIWHIMEYQQNDLGIKNDSENKDGLSRK